MFIVLSNDKPVAVTIDYDHARIVATQEKKDHPNHKVTYRAVPNADMDALLKLIQPED